MNHVPSDGRERRSPPRPRHGRSAPVGMHVAAAMLLLLVPSSSRAASPDTIESIVLTYETEGACPSQADFFGMIRGYTTRWEAVAEGSKTVLRTIHVRASTRRSDATGDLTVTSANGKASERHVVAPTCEAVSRALAIMVAVAIDPEALSDGQAAPSEEAPAVEPTTTPQDTPALVPTETRAPPPMPRSRLSSDLRAELTSAVVDAALPVLGFSVEVEPALFRPGAVPSWFRPSLGAGIRQSLPTELTRHGGSVELLWTAANARLCPVRFSTGNALLEIAFCAEMDLGRLSARARGFEGARQSSLVWLDFGGSTFATVSLTKHVFVAANVEVIAPYSRKRFELGSGALLSRAPGLGLLGGLGAGVRF